MLLAAFLLLLAVGQAGAEVIDRVLAVVAGDVITLTDVIAARDLGLESAGGAPDPVGAVLSKLIDRELVLAEVDRYAPPEPTAVAVDGEMDAVRRRFPSDEAFAAVLIRTGIDRSHLRGIVRDNLRISAYERQRFTMPPPSEDEVMTYYQAHADAFTRDGRLIPLESARPAVVEALADERRGTLIAEWVAGLRRRADVTDLYLAQTAVRDR